MLLLKRLLYGREFVLLFGLDCVLAFFKHTDFISNHLLFTGNESPELYNTLTHLTNDGMIEPVRNGYKITLAGKRKIARGGYIREAVWGRIIRLSVVVAIIGSVLAILL